MKRTGADKGHGSGYRNLRNFPKDPHVHRQSAKGMKQPQAFYAGSYAKLEAMGVKPQDSLVGTVYDKKSGKIIGFPQSHGFSQQGLNLISPNIKTFVFVDKEGNEVPVRAIDAKTAKMVIGVGNKYESEWGDYAGIIEGLNKGTWKLYEKNVEYMEHHKDMPVSEIDSMLRGLDKGQPAPPAPHVDYPTHAVVEPVKTEEKQTLVRKALALGKKAKEYGEGYLEKQKELARLKKQAEIETIEHPAVNDLKKQRERVTELEFQYATADDTAKKKLEKELEAERKQLREKQETVTNIKVEDLSDVELKLLAVRHTKDEGFFSGMFGDANPFKKELLRRIKFKRELERDMDTIERQQNELDKAAKEGKKTTSGGFFDFLP
ncbi:hypothetical protein MUP79_00215 [Candidatus Bathyarchaeota archaeon]|nr:hypothetical protein [Candidatus Bathyarchaeota archaeon]